MNLLEFTRIAKDESTFSFYFKIFSSGKEYTLKIEVCDKEEISWSCDCIFSSTFRFSKLNKVNGTTCKHCKFCRRLLKYIGEL